MARRHGYETLARSRVRRRFRPGSFMGLAGVLILAALSARGVEHAPKTYLETGTVVVAAPNVPLTDKPYSTVSGSLVTTSAVLAQSLMSPQAQALVREAGGTADVSLALVNFNNHDYPEYSYPLATLTAQSADPGVTRRTFQVALQVLRRLLARRQGHAGVRGRISVQLVGDTGAVTQPGSRKRSLAALGLLTVIAMVMISRFLTRHEDRLAGPLRRRHRYLPRA
jgi:hypothetical protein